MRQYWRYFLYLMRHKWYVGIECFKRGELIAALFHDMSKFLPDEFVPYARFFYGKGQPKNRGDTIQSGENAELKLAMEEAWLRHIHRNKHHWQYWISVEANGKLQVFDMPYDYIAEMVCDWEGASKALRGPKAKAIDWYNRQRETLVLSGRTRVLAENILECKEETIGSGQREV